MKTTTPLRALSLFTCACLFCSSLFAVTMRPVPKLTEGAISFIDEYLSTHPGALVLEFGSGASTVWFAKRSGFVTSVEHSPAWYQIVKARLEEERLRNVLQILKPLPYYSVCNEMPLEHFDLILVDGRNRKACIRYSIPLLKRGGVLVLDDIERPYYQIGIDLMKGWESHSDVQTEPDSCGHFRPGSTTGWWIKP